MEKKQVNSSEYTAQVQQFLNSDIVTDAMKFANIQYTYPAKMLYFIKRLFGYMYSLDGGTFRLYFICEAMEKEFEFSMFANPDLDGEPLSKGTISIDGTWMLQGMASLVDSDGVTSPILKESNTVIFPYKDFDEETMISAAQQIMYNSLPE